MRKKNFVVVIRDTLRYMRDGKIVSCPSRMMNVYYHSYNDAADAATDLLSKIESGHYKGCNVDIRYGTSSDAPSLIYGGFRWKDGSFCGYRAKKILADLHVDAFDIFEDYSDTEEFKNMWPVKEDK